MTAQNVYNHIKKRFFLYATPIVYGVIAFTPLVNNYYFLPDVLGISKLNPQDYFGLIIGAIASILGILIAVVLLAVEFAKERLEGDLLPNPMENQVIRNAIHNSVNLIGLSFFGYVQFQNFYTPKEITIGYFIGIFLLTYIYSIYNVIKHLVDKSSRIKENLNSIRSFNLNSFKNLSIYQLRESDQLDKRSIYIKDEIDSYIISNNITAYESLNSAILEQVFLAVGDGQNRTNCDIVFNALTRLWRDNTKTAIRANDFHYFEVVWKSVHDVYLYFAENKAPLLHVQSITLFLHVEYFKLHVKSNNGIPLSVALDSIEKSYLINLKLNCPDEQYLKHLVALYDKNTDLEHCMNEEIQWDQINSIASLLSKVQETAIDLEDRDLFIETTRRINNLCSEMFWSDFREILTSRQQGYITWSRLTSSFYYSKLALDKGLFENTLDAYNIPRYLLQDLIKNQLVNRKDIRVILQNLAEDLIDAYQNKKLYMETGIGTLNDFCLIGILSLKSYHSNQISEQTVDFIFRFLKYLKEYTEDQLLPHNQKEYSFIRNKMDHFLKVARDMENFDPQKKPVKRWEKIIKSFQEAETVKNDFKVKWKTDRKVAE